MGFLTSGKLGKFRVGIYVKRLLERNLIPCDN